MGTTEGPNVVGSAPTAVPPTLPIPEDSQYTPFTDSLPPDTVPLSSTVAAQQQAARDTPGAIETVKDIALNDWSLFWAERQMGSLSPSAGAPVTDEDIKQFEKDVPEELWSWANDAHSKPHLDAIKSEALAYAERERKIALTGTTGALTRLAVNLFDPTFIAASLASEGAAAPYLAAMKLGRVGRILTGAALAGTSNVAAEAAASTVNPTIDGKAMLEAFGYGAMFGGAFGALRRNPNLVDEANKAVLLGKKLVKRDTGSTAGAAATGQTLSPDYPTIDAEPSKAYGPRPDATGQLTKSHSKVAQLLGPELGELGGGFSDKSEVPIAATERGQMLFHSKRQSVFSLVGPAWDEWARGQDLNWFQRKWPGGQLKRFSGMIDDYIQDPRSNAADHYDPAVVRVGNRIRSEYADWLDQLQNPGKTLGKQFNPVEGFEAVSKDKTYSPRIADPEKIDELHTKFTREELAKFVQEAVLSENPTWSRDLAKNFGDNYLKRINEAGYGVRDTLHDAVRSGSKEAVEGALKEVGITDDQIRSDLVAKLAMPESNDSSRTMRRSPLDYGYTKTFGDGRSLSMKDFFKRDALETFDRYSREMSGRVSLAQVRIPHPDRPGEMMVDGITSDAKFDQLKKYVQQEYADKHAPVSKLERDMKNLDYLHRAILGRGDPAARGEYAAWLRRLRDFNIARLMSRLGLNELQEFGPLVARVGAKAMLSQMPSLRKIATQGMEEVYRKPLARELAAAGAIDQEHFGEARFKHLEEINGETVNPRDRFGRKIDNVMTAGKQITSTISFFRAVHYRLAQWAATSTAQVFADMAHGRSLKFLKGTNLDRLKASGMSEQMAQRVFAEIRQHSTVGSMSKLHELNLDQWDPEVRANFTATVRRMAHQMVLQNDAGTLPHWMSKPGWQLLLQFRTFMFGSYAKRTLALLNFKGLNAFSTVMWELFMGAATHMVNSVANAPMQSDPQAYLEKQMDPLRLAEAGFARSGFSTFVPAVVDSATSYVGRPTLEPDGWHWESKPLFDARSSASPNDLLFGVPALNFLDDSHTATSEFIQSMIEHRPMSKKGINAGMRSLPWGNWWPVTTLMGMMTSDHPYNAPRNNN
jgi:hypothetical protein